MSWRIFFKLGLFSLINETFKIPNFDIVSTSDVRFMTKTGPKNGPILTKIGVYSHHTSNQKRTKFHWNRMIFHSKIYNFGGENLSDFDKTWCIFGLRYGDYKYKVSSKSDHFLALFWLWITNRRHTQPQIFMIFFTYWNMKIDRVLKKLRTPIMGLSLLCRMNFRVWPHAYMGTLRPKIWCTVYYLAKRSYGAKFKQNPKNCPFLGVFMTWKSCLLRQNWI